MPHRPGDMAMALVAPLLQRWEAFTAKVWERFSELAGEADPGLDEVIAVDPRNSNAIAAAFSSLETRVRGLRERVSEAEEKLSSEWDRATDDCDLPSDERATLNRLAAQLVNQSRRLQHQLEWHGELLSIKKYADWSRVLAPLAQRECAQPRQCANCGGPIEVPIVHQASSVNCGHCGAVSSIDIGVATGLYFQGTGVHALARERAKDAWLNEQQADVWFKSLRHPTHDDRARFLDAARQHWLAYYRAYAELHPGFGRTPEQAAEDKLRHYTAWDAGGEVRHLHAFSELLRRVRARDANAVVQLISEAGLDPSDAVCAVHERGDRDGTMMMLDIQHRIESVPEPRAPWTAARLAELDEDLARR